MQEEEWKNKRNLAKSMFQAILVNIQDTEDTKVLLGPELDYCNIIKYNIDSLLRYWNERSIVSRVRFVVGEDNG